VERYLTVAIPMNIEGLALVMPIMDGILEEIMAIIIKNVSEFFDLPYGEGNQIYEVKVNSELIFVFNHKFEDGLAVCLQKASESVNKSLNERRENDTKR